MDELLARLKQPPDPAAALLYQTLGPLRNCLCFQAAFVAGCYQQAMELAAAQVQEKFTFTWQKRLAAYRMLPDESEGASSQSADAASPPELLIGIIGCGAVGAMIVGVMLDAGFAPSQLLVSTRSPQKQRALVDQGVRVAFDNERVAGRCHLLIVAVLPAQLPDVARAVRPVLSPRTLVLSAAAAIGAAKLRSLFTSANNPKPRVLPLRADPALTRALVRPPPSPPGPAAAAEAAEATGGGTAAAEGPAAVDGLLGLAAHTLAPDGAAVCELVWALGAAVHGLELGDEAAARLCASCALGGAPPEDLVRQLVPPAGDAGDADVPLPGNVAGGSAGAEAAPPVEAVLRLRFQRALEPLLVLPFR